MAKVDPVVDVSSDEESSSMESEERDDNSLDEESILDQLDALEFDWENAEDPDPHDIPINLEALKNDPDKYFAESNFKKIRFRLMDPVYETNEFKEMAADTKFIMVKGRVGSNRQINGVYEKEEKFRYVRQYPVHGQLSSKDKHVDKIILTGRRIAEGKPHILWKFGDDGDDKHAIAVCKSEGMTPQTTFKPWHVWSPEEMRWTIDYGINITALRTEEEQFTSFNKKVKLTTVQKNMIAQLAIRGKSKDSISRFININLANIEPHFTAALRTKEILFEDGKAEAREKEDVEKQLKAIGFRQNNIIQAIDTLNKDRNTEDQSNEFLKLMEEVRKKTKKEIKV